ncbi:tRNA epoxyqueuosine(34) reductase QueG [Shewanella gelidii]|uniref:Epoxyqueuosine reductase n=1 Tax=Shewanella gelidii TaxID=1642821 RepID=A0A917JK76_9GAMM|nr:tRNA epoxyqueuosine(34) reductase QueG [Shewanella gelidii]MCL1096814.1 tRNA epoxyqueuosine(34) reductase QueG [Shewanella gelidii]GGI70357.1 epoxyqueuosine reductase [Shewanella gelidii]
MPQSDQSHHQQRPVSELPSSEASVLARLIKQWGNELGFAQIGICDVDLSAEEPKFQAWLDKQYHGEMAYMESHGMMRARPAELHTGTTRVISARMNYLPPQAGFATSLKAPSVGYISRYAGGRDYHKMMRNGLKKLGQKIQSHLQALGYAAPNYRPFVDSAPALERPLANKAGLGWTGKHSLLLNPNAGSWFFLGELFIDIALPLDIAIEEACGSCVACIKSCPTDAIIEPYIVDARRCISYLTIELQGAIPEEFRPLIGNRIYGCDDCQLVCPVNAKAPLTEQTDFHTRANLINPDLLELFSWDEAKFLKITEGSPIRRLGHHRWLRNIAIAIGNAPTSEPLRQALQLKKQCKEIDAMVLEHIDWALAQHQMQLEQGQSALTRKTQRVIKAVEKGLVRDA